MGAMTRIGHACQAAEETGSRVESLARQQETQFPIMRSTTSRTLREGSEASTD